MESSSRPQLCFGQDLSSSSTPKKSPSAHSHRVLVIGGGVTGLVTSWLLLDKGYHVTIVSKEWASWTPAQRLTSQIAGALWEFPPGGCGPQPFLGAIDRCREWALESYHVYCDMARDRELAKAFGVRVRSLAMLFPSGIVGDEKWEEKMRTIEKSAIKGFRHDANVIRERLIDPDFEVKDAYEHDAPMIDSDQAMQWLMQTVKSKGAKLVTAEMKGQLRENETRLLKQYSASAIVNATGLGAREIGEDDSVYPVRGAIFRFVNDGTDFPQITKAAVVNSETDETGNYKDLIFMVPRNDDILIVGSIVQPHEWVLNLTVDSPVVKQLRERLNRFMPVLKKARLDPQYPLAQGLRPFRLGSPRVERDLSTYGRYPSKVVHSYGHGGAGWSLAFGCAAESVALVEEVLSESSMPLKDQQEKWEIPRVNL
ncbi:MAG: hypothetical protein M1812_006385 [Candelaria pacifica]|nr:MAG: hypothetical protein M1812_006385 [Candelaria pacifica]